VLVQHEGSKVTKLQLCMSLYDSAYRQFFGRTWIGPVTDVKHGCKLAYNQVEYCGLSVLVTLSTHIIRSYCTVCQVFKYINFDLCIRCSTFSCHSFTSAGPTVWNSLPGNLHNPVVGPDSFGGIRKLSCLPVVSVSLTVHYRCFFYILMLYMCTFTS